MVQQASKGQAGRGRHDLHSTTRPSERDSDVVKETIVRRTYSRDTAHAFPHSRSSRGEDTIVCASSHFVFEIHDGKLPCCTSIEMPRQSQQRYTFARRHGIGNFAQASLSKYLPIERREPLFQWISALAPLSKRSNGARKKKENGFSLLLCKRKDGSARGLSDVAFNGDRRQKITLAVAFFV